MERFATDIVRLYGVSRADHPKMIPKYLKTAEKGACLYFTESRRGGQGESCYMWVGACGVETFHHRQRKEHPGLVLSFLDVGQKREGGGAYMQSEIKNGVRLYHTVL